MANFEKYLGQNVIYYNIGGNKTYPVYVINNGENLLLKEKGTDMR